MKISTYPVEKPDLDSQILKPTDRGDSWLMSYSDLVTVLLCFFILFFMMKARQQEKEFIAKHNSSGKQELIFSDVTQQLGSSSLSAKAQIAKFERHIEITARNVFFKEDSHQLNLEGEYFFAELALKIFKYMPDLQIQISIAAEGSTLTSKETINRMNIIRDYLTNLGIEPELISVGTHKSDTTLTEEKMEEIKVFISKNYRKIIK